jgi:hypothetical protein
MENSNVSNKGNGHAGKSHVVQVNPPLPIFIPASVKDVKEMQQNKSLNSSEELVENIAVAVIAVSCQIELEDNDNQNLPKMKRRCITYDRERARLAVECDYMGLSYFPGFSV